jgi:hypothetical protein
MQGTPPLVPASKTTHGSPPHKQILGMLYLPGNVSVDRHSPSAANVDEGDAGGCR